MIGSGRLALFVLLALALAAPSRLEADTNTATGDRSGEGSTPFTGLAGSPETNLFTGALGTSIPIDVPPGRKDMTPKLALTYSSQSGPSPFGYGWDLPIGRIERTTKFGVPRCDSIHFDTFSLMLPGVAAELVRVGNGEYRPRVEQSYLKAVLAGNTWTVTDAAGMKYTFGQHAESRVGTVPDPPLELSTNGTCNFTTA
jgi:hypothetical protein